jgi:hypothetical protein
MSASDYQCPKAYGRWPPSAAASYRRPGCPRNRILRQGPLTSRTAASWQRCPDIQYPVCGHCRTGQCRGLRVSGSRVQCQPARTSVSAPPAPTLAQVDQRSRADPRIRRASQDCGSRRADGRRVRRLSAVADLSAVLPAGGCGRVRRGRPDGCRSARCPRCRRNGGRCPDGAVHRGHCCRLRVSAATGSGHLAGVRW